MPNDEQALYDMELIPVDDNFIPEMAELAKSYLRYTIIDKKKIIYITINLS